MIVVIDSSVLLRKLFGEPEPLEQWPDITDAYASRLMLVEVGRTIDRCRLAGSIDDAEVAHLQQEFRSVLGSIEIVGMSERILNRAGASMPTVVGSLDAVHLATAIEVNEALEEPVALATHDDQLARAGRASGLLVFGI